jgi:uracil-DNA glycosylase
VAKGDALFRLWTDLDRCDGCRDRRFADADAPHPARPFRLPPEAPILFIGEAPPKTGGFWKPRNGDAVRRLLLPTLPTWPDAIDWDSQEAIDWFVDAGFFFIQTMKWPLIRQSYLKLTTRQKCLAVDHAVGAHLGREIELIEPGAIIALGAAALDGCLLLAERCGGPPLDPSRVTRARLRHHGLRSPSGRIVPLHTTFLPGKINESVPQRLDAIREDVGVFLRCIADGDHCEGVGRRSLTMPEKPNREGTVVEGDEGFREWRRDISRRMKAVGLRPLPQGMTFEEAMLELERREGAGEGQAES